MWELEAGTLLESFKTMSIFRETVFDFVLKSSVSKKGFSNLYTFKRSVESDMVVEKIFTSIPVEGFSHVEKHRSDLYVIVMVFAEWMGEFSEWKY